MEGIINWITTNTDFIGKLFAAGGIGAALSLVLKRAFTREKKEAFKKQIEEIADALGDFGKPVGVAITAGLSKFGWTSKLWNVVFEPYVIILGDLIIESFVVRTATRFWSKLVEGLKSDNPSYSG
jgi:peroxiredoxin